MLHEVEIELTGPTCLEAGNIVKLEGQELAVKRIQIDADADAPTEVRVTLAPHAVKIKGNMLAAQIVCEINGKEYLLVDPDKCTVVETLR